ncbi:hypothetical protein FKW77_000791 [Venturia effusa]|uniref:Uncharacterized protein n=1 Tax=Venturia effusa TaxID=50376 RepID=A0A517LHZ0_9PEZI|nr:hypothetical protein FKW77_000791 [Venturia effusa]
MPQICQNAGAPNADIAGLGIAIAFAIQAFISILLSTFAEWQTRKWKRSHPHEWARTRPGDEPDSHFDNPDAYVSAVVKSQH